MREHLDKLLAKGDAWSIEYIISSTLERFSDSHRGEVVAIIRGCLHSGEWELSDEWEVSKAKEASHG